MNEKKKIVKFVISITKYSRCYSHEGTHHGVLLSDKLADDGRHEGLESGGLFPRQTDHVWRDFHFEHGLQVLEYRGMIRDVHPCGDETDVSLSHLTNFAQLLVSKL